MTQMIDAADLRPARLTHLSGLLISGADAKTFLQGQLSADVESLNADRAMLASCYSAE
jgi:folate-binding Fe-S cluster repair protein YgfZ